MRLTLYPAIDLKGGACVRLRQGDMRDVTVFSDDPAGQAGAFAAAGARWLHIVDLDGAFAGETVNRRAIEGILASVAIPVQLGGGLRDMTAIRFWLDAGVRRVVLGSAAIKDPVLVRNAAREYPGRIAVGVDARDGFVAAEGWAETSHLSAFELARRFEGAGVAALIFTDIARDGMLAGAAIEATLELAETVSIPVIASGGIGGAEDLRALRDAAMAGGRRRLEGVIVGRALYDGRLDCAEALRILAGTEGADGRVAGTS